jgi:hypothetical protein
MKEVIQNLAQSNSKLETSKYNPIKSHEPLTLPENVLSTQAEVFRQAKKDGYDWASMVVEDLAGL